MSEFLTRTQICLGTVISVKILNNPAILEQIFDRIKEYEKIFSLYLNQSDVTKINNNAGKKKIRVVKSTLRLIEKAIYYSDLTNMAIDITIEPILQAWGFTANTFCLPDQNIISDLLPLVNYRDIRIENDRVGLEKNGQKLSLGAIAKGYITDRIIDFLKHLQIRNALLNLGGNIYAWGKNQANNPWQIGIQHPQEKKGTAIGIIYVTDVSVVTSGIYERYFYKRFKRYHHLIDPRTGKQPEHNLVSVTVICHASIEADALATAFFIMGFEASANIIKKMKHIDAIFINRNKEIWLTHRLKERFHLLKKNYKTCFF